MNIMKFLLSFLLSFFILVLSNDAFGQSSASLRKKELEAVKIREIPLAGYDEPRPEDAPPLLEPAYTYWGYVTAIRDVDTVRGWVDVGFHTRIEFDYRYYAIDGFEITRKGGRSASHVNRGYKCRDLMVEWLGSDAKFPKTAKYHEFKQPIQVVVKSYRADKFAKRWNFSVHKDGKNLNQFAARSGCAIVTTFTKSPVYYPRDTPISDPLK